MNHSNKIARNSEHLWQCLTSHYKIRLEMCEKINFLNDLPKNSTDIYGRQPLRYPPPPNVSILLVFTLLYRPLSHCIMIGLRAIACDK